MTQARTGPAQAVHVVCANCNAINRVPEARLGEGPKCGQCGQPLFAGRPIELTAESFDRHATRNDVPLVVDFWAEWCGPCKAMAPAYEQAAVALEPRFRLARLDTEAAPAIAARYGIRSIPTLIIFKGGRELARQPGAMGAQDIVRWVQSHSP